MVTKIQNTVSTENSTLVAGNAAIIPAKRLVEDKGVRRDAVEGGGTSSSNVVAETTRSTGENPFAALAAGAVRVDGSTLRLADSADATSESVEPSLEMMHLVSNLEAELATRGVWSAERIRNGMMQTTYDAQEDRVARTGVSREDSEALATKLIDRPTTGDAKAVMNAQEWHIPVSGYFKGGDVNAFVQQVLRECYLLGNLDLQMYGERVKSLNEMKKKIREEADRARKVKSDWAAQAQGDANWVSPTVYETVKVDGAQMALIPGAYADVQATANAAGHLAGSDAVAGAPRASGFFAAGSSLESGDSALMESIGFYGADSIQKNYLKELAGIIPKMNASDVQQYLLPVLRELLDAGHHGSIVQLFRSMTDEQVMMVVANGISPEAMRRLENKEFGEITARIRTAELNLMPDAEHVPGTVVTQLEARKVWSDYEAKKNPARPEDNGSLARLGHARDGSLSRYDAQRRLPSDTAGAQTATTEGPSEQTPPSTVDTVEKMEAYVKYLEEQMNSVGDDAQLANVDLQNCLQKQQQTMQMMSTISKMLHEVTMAIIRNMNS